MDKTILATLDDQFRIVKSSDTELKASSSRGGVVELDIRNLFTPGRPVFAVATITHFGVVDQNLKDNVHIYAYRDTSIEVRTGDSNGGLSTRGFTIAIHGTIDR